MEQETLQNRSGKLTDRERLLIEYFRACTELYQDNVFDFALTSAAQCAEQRPRNVILLADPFRKFR